MLLHDSLDAAVADVHADLPALTTASRRHGLSIRRRRRALSAVGAAAAVTLLVASGVAVRGGGPRDGVAVDVASPVAVGTLSGATAPTTDGGVVAALADSVDRVADGTFGQFQGQVGGYESMAALLFLPERGAGPAGQVIINIQPLDGMGTPPYSCLDAWFPGITDCTTRRLADGDTLRTYWQLDDREFGDGSQRMAVEVLSPARGLRVVVNVLNTNPWAVGDYRDEPVLDLEQATVIATQPWWSRLRLPAEYVAAGETLELAQG